MQIENKIAFNSYGTPIYISWSILPDYRYRNTERDAIEIACMVQYIPFADYRLVNFWSKYQPDGSLPANPVNDRRVANAVTLKTTFRLP